MVEMQLAGKKNLNPKNNMKIIHDTHADAINITFREGKVAKTIEIAPEINLDLDKKGNPLYLEIIGAREKLGKENAEEFLMKNIAAKTKTVSLVK